jgi:hypothetical protein
MLKFWWLGSKNPWKKPGFWRFEPPKCSKPGEKGFLVVGAIKPRKKLGSWWSEPPKCCKTLQKSSSSCARASEPWKKQCFLGGLSLQNLGLPFK